MRIFLTGATGHAGQEVVAEFVRRGFEVTALTRKLAQIFGCRTLVADLIDPLPFIAALRGSEAVVHLASSRGTGMHEVLRDIAGTANLIEYWKSGPFVSISSGWLYVGDQVPMLQKMPVNITNGYEVGKLCDEFQLRAALPSGSRGPAISLRPGMLFGAGPRRNDRRMLSTLYEHCKANVKFRFGSEESLETFGSSYIGTVDYARAVADALGLNASGVYNIAGGFCTWKSLIETINRIAGTRADFVVRSDGSTDPGEFWLRQSRVCLDVGAFKAQTGFAPRQSLEDLVEEYVAAERATVGSNPGVKTAN